MTIQDKPIHSPSLLIIVSLTIAAFLSRFYGIWEWDLVGDENFTAMFAYERYQSFINPAYYSLVVVFYEIFGHEYWISRIPALILSILSVPILYLTWSKAIGRNAALFAACILILSAWHLWYSQFARHYAGVFLFSTLAYYYFYRAIASDRIPDLGLALFFSLISILFHATAVWVPASCAIAYLAIALIHRNSDYSQRIIKIYLIICGLAALAIIPLGLRILDIWTGQAETWGYGAILIIPQLVKYIQIPIVISAMFGWFLLVTKKPLTATFFAIAIAVPMLFLVVATPFMAISPAYAFSILPLLIILSGIACEEVRRSLSDKSKLFSYFTFILLLVSLVPSFVSHFLEKTSLNFNSVVSFIDEHHRQGDKILSFAPGFNNKSDKEYDMVPFISYERDLGIDWSDKLDPLLNSGHRTWVVTTNKRKPLAPELESWLFCNASIVWQKNATRIDYEVSGYNIFLIDGPRDQSRSLPHCKTIPG